MPLGARVSLGARGLGTGGQAAGGRGILHDSVPICPKEEVNDVDILRGLRWCWAQVVRGGGRLHDSEDLCQGSPWHEFGIYRISTKKALPVRVGMSVLRTLGV